MLLLLILVYFRRYNCAFFPSPVQEIKEARSALKKANTLTHTHADDNNGAAAATMSGTEILSLSFARLINKCMREPLLSKLPHAHSSDCHSSVRLRWERGNSFIPLSGFILIPSVERFNGFILMCYEYVYCELYSGYMRRWCW
jgi:hypothetical protein